MKDHRAQLDELLVRQGGLYTFDDVLACIDRGTMQSFAKGDTWAVTQIHIFPRRKVVDMVFVLGDMNDVKDLESEVIAFAKEIGATLLMATGRLGWLKSHFDGWHPVSANFVKEL